MYNSKDSISPQKDHTLTTKNNKGLRPTDKGSSKQRLKGICDKQTIGREDNDKRVGVEQTKCSDIK
jgi:hypothetical protein